MASLDASPPPSPIQRILIFHSTLPESCMDGKSLGEGASIQEISEQIMYYHRDQQWAGELPAGGLPTPRTKTSLTEEAVQFLGLCTALYGLPSALGDPETPEERTNEIYFGKSTLVFVPLESSTVLLAVIQVPRLYQERGKTEMGGGNPLGVRSSIERYHQLFCLLRCGGILNRLKPSLKEMGKLYALLKQMRRQSEKSLRARAPDRTTSIVDGGFDDETVELKQEAKALWKKLPIQSIRRDLDAHYKEYIGDQTVSMSRHGGSGRCLVDNVPAPIADSVCDHATASLPTRSSTFTTVSLGIAVRRLLGEFAQNSTQQLQLLGISTFIRGKLCFSHLSEDTIGRNICVNRDCLDSVEISNETVHLLMSHMSSYKMKASQMPASSQNVSQSSASSHSPFGLSSLAPSFRDSTTSSKPSLGMEKVETNTRPINGMFIQPPPQFMLSASEKATVFEDRKGPKAWALNVHLPLKVWSEECARNLVLGVQVLVFEVEDYSFLLFVETKSNSNVGESLATLSRTLCALVIDTCEKDWDVGLTCELNAVPDIRADPGQDLLLVDRAQHTLILLSDRKQQGLGRSPGRSSSKKSSARRFLGFGSRGQDKFASETTLKLKNSGGEWAAFGLDCRHFLASQLHLDTLLAFDDMMNEVARRKAFAGEATSRNLPWETGAFKDDAVELCTCMSLGWVYAYAKDSKELYSFFDSSIYVTVADVQSAAIKTKVHFFGTRAPNES